MTRLALSALILTLSIGCAGLRPPATPGEQASAIEQARQDIDRFANAAEKAATGLNATLDIEIEIRKAFPDKISLAEHDQFLDWIERPYDLLDAALIEAKSLLTHHAIRRDVMRRLIQLARSKLEDVPMPITDPALQRMLTAALAAVLLSLQMVLS